jgi:hypothetical protein
MNRIFQIQNNIQDIHPFLKRVFPIGIAENGQISVYEPVFPGDSYQFVEMLHLPMPVPPGVRAAFPLDPDGSRMACVVTGDVFGSLDGYVTIFHEFIHCQQFEICEFKIKQFLEIFRQAQANNDFMWEINHPFPYADYQFSLLYAEFLKKASQGDLDEVRSIRVELGQHLNQVDYEYMIWQEWKEGLARWVENRINSRLGLPINQGGWSPPFSRVSFYAGGEQMVNLIEKVDSSIIENIEILFHQMQHLS